MAKARGRVADVMASGEATVDDLRDLYNRDELRVPSVVTSYSPAADAPVRVSVRADRGDTW